MHDSIIKIRLMVLNPYPADEMYWIYPLGKVFYSWNNQGLVTVL